VTDYCWFAHSADVVRLTTVVVVGHDCRILVRLFCACCARRKLRGPAVPTPLLESTPLRQPRTSLSPFTRLSSRLLPSILFVHSSTFHCRLMTPIFTNHSYCTVQITFPSNDRFHVVYPVLFYYFSETFQFSCSSEK